MLAGGEGGLWRSLDGGATFARLDPHKFPDRGTPGTLKQLKWDGPHAILIASDDTVFVAARGTGGGVYRTANAQAPAPTVERAPIAVLWMGEEEVELPSSLATVSDVTRCMAHSLHESVSARAVQTR